MTTLKSRLKQVVELSCRIFDQNYNPTGVRTGAKVLAKRLKGPAIADYYGKPDMLTIRNLRTLYPGLQFTDLNEEYRLSMLEARKRRGKGAPKKLREARDDSGKKRKK